VIGVNPPIFVFGELEVVKPKDVSGFILGNITRQNYNTGVR
jgi:hypothetical protein